jgi:hypothetical protein
MLYMIVNRTHTDLTKDQWEELGKLAQEFYDNIPEGVTLHGDWAATDGSCTFSLLEADDVQLIENIQEPFRPYVDMELVPVQRISGWGKR